MKSLKLKILAAKIEYHWWRVDCLRRKCYRNKERYSPCCEDFHKFRAEQLSVLYEMYLGLRDFCGNIVA